MKSLEERLIKRGQLSGRTDDQDIDKIRNRFNEYNHYSKTMNSINFC